MKKSRNRSIFIFGASGFIGKYLADKFRSDSSFQVHGYSSKSCNLLSLTEVKQALSVAEKNDAIIIASAITRPKDSYKAMMKNFEMIENCCRAVQDRIIGHVTFLSTIDVYGIEIEKHQNINERFLANPDDYYSISKIGSEFMLKQTCSRIDIPLTILRLPGIYGPGDGFKSTIGGMVKRAFTEKKIIVYGEGTDLRDYVYVNDVYEVAIKAIEDKKNVLVNMCTGNSRTIKDICLMIRDLLPFNVEIEYGKPVDGGARRIEYLQFECEKVKREFPRLSVTELKAGISAYIDYVNNLDRFIIKN